LRYVVFEREIISDPKRERVSNAKQDPQATLSCRGPTRHIKHSARTIQSQRGALVSFVRDDRAPWLKTAVEPIDMPGMITDEEAQYYEWIVIKASEKNAVTAAARTSRLSRSFGAR
jgi:hypothetical protein